MSEMQKIISDEEIERVHSGANFGDRPKRAVVNNAVLKAACGYRSGSTATQIIREHGLIKDNGKLTKKGWQYLWAAFSTEGK